VDGTTGAGPLRTSIDNSFVDTINDSDSLFAFMGRGEARRGRLGLFLDLMYSRLGYNDVGVSGSATRADATSTTLILEFGDAWQIAEGSAGPNGRWELDAIGGGRWTRMRTEISVIGGGPSADTTTHWVDPFAGLRLRGRLGERWEFTLRGDIGGGLGGSRFAWHVASTIGYRFELFGIESAALVGYRALYQDFHSSKLVWDVTMHGPLIGLNLRF
jgi:hypothetical protein